jgi:hypothetical protein
MREVFIIKQLLQLFIGILFSTGFSNPAIEQWIQTNGPPGGKTVKAFVFKGMQAYTCIDEQFYFSSNGGDSWTLSTLPPSSSINVLFCFKSSLFAGTTQGLFRTSNNGMTWSPAGLTDTYIKCLADSGAYLFAGTSKGVFCSSNEGNDWTLIALKDCFINAVAVRCNIVFAGTDSGVYKITNVKNEWKTVKITITKNDYQAKAFAMIDTTIFVTFDNASVFYSSNCGTSWVSIDGYKYTRFDKTIAVLDTYLFAVSDSGIWRYSRTGDKWDYCDKTPKFSRLLAISDTVLFVGTWFSGMYRSTDRGLTWKPCNWGIIKSNINCLGLRGKELYAAPQIEGGMYRSTDNGNTWVEFNKGLSGSVVNCFALRDSDIFIGTNDAEVYRLTDSIGIWSQKLSVQDYYNHPKISAIAAKDSIVYVGISNSLNYSLCRSTDKGETFTYVNHVPGEKFSGDLNVTSLVFNGATIFLHCSEYSYPINGVYYSIDGNHFNSLCTGNEYGGDNNLLASGPYIFMFSVSRWLYKMSTDTIIKIPNSEITKLPKCSLVKSGETFIVSTDRDISISTNEGSNWIPFNSGLPDDGINCLTLNNEYLFVATASHGVWRRPVSDLAQLYSLRRQDASIQGTNFKINNLSSLKSLLTIQISLASAELVSIKVFNLCGKEIATLFNKRVQLGRHNILWNTGNLSSGYYFVMMHAGAKNIINGVTVLH